MHQILSEILQEPEAVRASVELGFETYRDAATAFLGKNCNRVYAVGCGSSYFAGILARYAIEQFLGVPTIARSAVDFLNHSLGTLDQRAAVLGISQSGESFETIDAVQRARGRAGLILGLTNNARSSLARVADAALLTAAGPEKASGTKTVLTQMSAAYQFALAAAEAKGTVPQAELEERKAELRRAHEVVAEMHGNRDRIQALAEYLRDVNNLYVVCAGPFYPLALQITNTAREIVRVHAQAFDVTEFRHGPLEILRKGSHLLLISSSSCVQSAGIHQMAKLAHKAGATVIVATDAMDRPLIQEADYLYEMPKLSEMMGAVLYLAAFHLVLYYWSVAKGLDPDRFENIVKTWTQEVRL